MNERYTKFYQNLILPVPFIDSVEMTTARITIVNKIAEVMDIHAHRFITTGNFGEAFSGSSLSILILLFASSGEEYSDFIIVVKLSWTLCI